MNLMSYISDVKKQVGYLVGIWQLLLSISHRGFTQLWPGESDFFIGMVIDRSCINHEMIWIDAFDIFMGISFEFNAILDE